MPQSNTEAAHAVEIAAIKARLDRTETSNDKTHGELWEAVTGLRNMIIKFADRITPWQAASMGVLSALVGFLIGIITMLLRMQ